MVNINIEQKSRRNFIKEIAFGTVGLTITTATATMAAQPLFAKCKKKPPHIVVFFSVWF